MGSAVPSGGRVLLGRCTVTRRDGKIQDLAACLFVIASFLTYISTCVLQRTFHYVSSARVSLIHKHAPVKAGC